MTDLVTQYQKGETGLVVEALRKERTLSGEGILHAGQIADLIIDRCQQNFEIIAERLKDLGFQFKRPDGPFSLADDADRGELKKVQQRWGDFPVLIRKWYERFSFVDFCQAEEQLNSDGPLRGLGAYPQLLTLPLPEILQQWEDSAEDYEQHVRFMTEVMETRGETYAVKDREFALYPGPYASNCDPKGFSLPSTEFDPEYYDDGAGPMTFYDDLKIIFKNGGFPHLAVYIHHEGIRDMLGMENPDALRDTLASDLIPI